ncbi:tetratricopeptide repeat protein [Wenyingzhuangia sp. IMCC45467]
MEKILLGLLVLFMYSHKINSQSAQLKYADSLFLLGNYSKAIEVYKNNKQEDVSEKIAEAYLGIGNYDLSLEYYKKSIIAKPNNILVMYKYGKLLSKTKQYNEALKVFNKLLEQDDKNPNYHYQIGLILENQEKKEALNKFKTAFNLDNTHQKSIYKIAKNQLVKKQYDSVNYYVNIGLRSYVNNRNLISLKAQNYYNSKRYLEAVKWFEQLIKLNELSKFIHERLSYSYKKINKPRLAIKHQLLAIEFDTKDASNLYTLGQLYEEEEEYKNAEKYIQAAITILDVSLDKKYLRLGYVQNQQYEYKKAIQSFKKAIKESPNNPEAHFYIIYTKDKYYGDIDTRINLYENFMEKFPNNKFKSIVEFRLKTLRKEKFLKGDNEG